MSTRLGRPAAARPPDSSVARARTVRSHRIVRWGLPDNPVCASPRGNLRSVRDLRGIRLVEGSRPPPYIYEGVRPIGTESIEPKPNQSTILQSITPNPNSLVSPPNSPIPSLNLDSPMCYSTSPNPPFSDFSIPCYPSSILDRLNP